VDGDIGGRRLVKMIDWIEGATNEMVFACRRSSPAHC
jgi:hypothetical protein